MMIKGDVVTFRTNEPLYGREKEGLKPYTVRILDQREHYAATDPKIKRIRIKRGLATKEESFERKILSIFSIAEFLGRSLVGIAWIHEEETETPEQ